MESLRFNILWFLFGVTATIGFYFLESYALATLWGFCSAVLVGTIRSEDKHPIIRFLIRIYNPVASWTLRWKWVVIAASFILIIATVPVYFKLGSEFMPPLAEGSILYMPTTMPGISITEAERLLQVTDRIIKQFPEVEHVLGKAGRAETLDRSCPAVHDRDSDNPQVQVRVAEGRDLVFFLGA